jgi:peroxiredoxin
MMPPGGEATDSPLVGKHAADFVRNDSTGREVNLKALLKSSNVILMFYKGLW